MIIGRNLKWHQILEFSEWNLNCARKVVLFWRLHRIEIFILLHWNTFRFEIILSILDCENGTRNLKKTQYKKKWKAKRAFTSLKVNQKKNKQWHQHRYILVALRNKWEINSHFGFSKMHAVTKKIVCYIILLSAYDAITLAEHWKQNNREVITHLYYVCRVAIFVKEKNKVLL